MSLSFDEAKQYLQQEFPDEPSLYSHLVQCIKKVLYEKPNNPAKALGLIKDEKFQEAPMLSKDTEKVQQLLQFTPSEDRNVQDISKLAYLLSRCGIQIPPGETELLAASIERLCEQESLLSCRFWGKINAKVGPYYIVEAEVQDNTNDHDTTVIERLGSGLNTMVNSPQYHSPVPVEVHEGPNKSVYFVTTKLQEPWKMLPEVIPHHIAVSRDQKFTLTGHLENIIRGYPPFFGTESQLLRAIIARISASSTVSPIHFYVFEEDEDTSQLLLNEEYQPEPASELAKLDNWVHSTPYLLPQGRTSYVNTKVAKQEDEEDEMMDTNASQDQDEKMEVGPSLLTSIALDQEHFNMPPWSTRVFGIQEKSKVVLLRNHRWPGAYALYQNGTFYNIYLGNGIKDFEQDMTMPLPQPVEPSHMVEEEDPIEEKPMEEEEEE